ncbi:MAG: CDP-alcohol phosphatidyltransferase family protein, partial [Deltaproteobacteria bacterium]|nr:CDP-alcohol phosphatidyltransferase family protein [Deltaproteobacteria bacterium]
MKINKILTKILNPPDKLINSLVGKGFGLKDLFTLINLAGGVAGIVLAVMGRPVDASYAVLAGFILGDSLDGYVARLTEHSNQFGSDFDTITDHFSQCIAPAFIVFSHVTPHNFKLGITLLFIIIAAGSIRHARNTAVKFSFPFCWKGLPRPIGAM